MSDNLDRAKIIDKIEKLLALSKSPNENEALAAADKAYAMLAQYNLTLDDLNGEKDPVIRDTDFLTDDAAWTKPLLGQVSKNCFCWYFFEKFPADWVKKHGLDKTNRKIHAGWTKHRLRHNFVGKTANIIVAKNMGEYLISAMEAICREEQKAYPQAERSRFSVAFMNACAARLCHRLEQRRLASLDKPTETGGINLPALRPLYDQMKEQVEDWKELSGIEFRIKESLIQINHAGGARAGHKAGERIGLDTQISG